VILISLKFCRRAVPILALLSLMLCSDLSRARDEKGVYMVVGPGTISCGKWTEIRSNKTAWTAEIWLLGYISAYNQYVPNDRQDLTDHVDVEGVFGWIDNWCKANPLAQLNTAATKLVTVLQNNRYP
jgi:hypothetical protein